MRKSALFGILLLGISAPAYAGEQERAMVTGAFLGAMTGAAIGSNSGEAGKGAVVGAFVGTIAGAILSDMNRQPVVVTHHQQPHVAYSGTPVPRPARQARDYRTVRDYYHGRGHDCEKGMDATHNPPYHARKHVYSEHTGRYEVAHLEERHAVNRDRGDGRERMHRHSRGDRD